MAAVAQNGHGRIPYYPTVLLHPLEEPSHAV